VLIGALWARASDRAWARRAVGEGVRSCPRAGCGRSACPVHGEQGRRPVVIGRPRHRDEPRTGALGKVHPRIDIRRKLLGERHDRLRPRERDIRCRLGHAVGHCRRKRHIVGRGVDQACKARTHRLAGAEEVVGRDHPRLRLAGEPAPARRDRCFGQRRHVRAIEERNMVRNIEQMALTGEQRGAD
jgi:hypothetical protein